MNKTTRTKENSEHLVRILLCSKIFQSDNIFYANISSDDKVQAILFKTDSKQSLADITNEKWMLIRT